MKMKTAEQQRIADEMQRAISAYTGPVTKCPPGAASAANVRKWQATEAGQYLTAHSDDPPNPSAEARRHHMAQMKRKRIAEHNAPILRRIEKQKRKTARNMVIIKRENEPK
jgi:hypothetical protein